VSARERPAQLALHAGIGVLGCRAGVQCAADSRRGVRAAALAANLPATAAGHLGLICAPLHSTGRRWLTSMRSTTQCLHPSVHAIQRNLQRQKE
jgi:hypothetical protein